MRGIEGRGGAGAAHVTSLSPASVVVVASSSTLERFCLRRHRDMVVALVFGEMGVRESRSEVNRVSVTSSLVNDHRVR